MIRRLGEDDLEALWRLRLQALTDNPEAFGSTYQETIGRGQASIRQRLQAGDDTFYLGAFEQGLIGIVGFIREGGVKERHKGYLVSLYVLPEKRGQGVGAALAQALIAEAGQLEGLEQLHLAVVTSAHGARRLYESLGFEVYGTAPTRAEGGRRVLG